ncbi:hypothetical protein H4R33_001649 [Dimargaris cristalligena]|nr:hypothetical protein H4R33_001649 [Dimargaris cristalligena]
MKRSNDSGYYRDSNSGGGNRRDYPKRPRHAPHPNMAQNPMYPYGMGMMGMDMNAMMAAPYGMPMGNPQFNTPMMDQSQVGGQHGYDTRNPPTRTIYLGGVPAGTTFRQILDQSKFGVVESVRILAEKNCAFVSFLDESTAIAMMQATSFQPFRLNNQDVKVRFGKSIPVPLNILTAVQNGASRNVYLGNLDPSQTADEIREALREFGEVEHFNLVESRHIAFAHFTNIASAIKCVDELPRVPGWSDRRVSFGKDRCAYNPKPSMDMSMDPSAMMYPNNPMAAGFMPHGDQGYDPYGMAQGGFDPSTAAMMAGYGAAADPSQTTTNRTVYISNIHPEATVTDLCNAVRGGAVYQIRYIPDKRIAFVSFLDPMAAMAFHQLATFSGVAVKSRRLRVGWGHPSAVPPPVAQAVQQGASRNIYIGSLDESMTAEKLRADFSQFGDIELVNILPEKNCGFVNFTSIRSAMKAHSGIKESNPEYGQCRINFGRDRCAQPPRPPHQHGSRSHNNNHGNNNGNNSSNNDSGGRNDTSSNPDYREDGPTGSGNSDSGANSYPAGGNDDQGGDASGGYYVQPSDSYSGV